MIKIQGYNILKKRLEKVKQTSYKRQLKIKKLEYKVCCLEEELKICKKKVKEQELIIGWLQSTNKQ